jgi:hypothetical protein
MFTKSGYTRRRNHDGSFDSICLCCFRTVASDDNEARLAERERQHRCANEDLVKFSHLQELIPANDRGESPD